MTLERRYTSQLGRSVLLRDNDSDDGMWEEAFGRELHVPPNMPTPKIVLDLGANIGLTAAHYQELWPEALVLAVEMDAENAALARQNFSGVVYQKAVSGYGGPRFYSTDVTASAYALTGDGEKRVESQALLSLAVDFFGDTAIDFCKMDVEGAEWEILRAAKDGWGAEIKYLLVEFHGSDPPEVLLSHGLQALREAGYEAFHHEIHPHAAFAYR